MEGIGGECCDGVGVGLGGYYAGFGILGLCLVISLLIDSRICLKGMLSILVFVFGT